MITISSYTIPHRQLTLPEDNDFIYEFRSYLKSSPQEVHYNGKLAGYLYQSSIDGEKLYHFHYVDLDEEDNIKPYYVSLGGFLIYQCDYPTSEDILRELEERLSDDYL